MWTKTPPTTEGWKYWKVADDSREVTVVWVGESKRYGLAFYISTSERALPVTKDCGVWWDSDVPEPGAVERLRVLCGEAARILKMYADDEECCFDHHGYCQSHGWMMDNELCINKQTIALIDELEQRLIKEGVAK